MDKTTSESKRIKKIPQIYHFNTQYVGLSQYCDSVVVKMHSNTINGGIFSKNRFSSEEYLLNFSMNSKYVGNRMTAGEFYQSGGLLTLSEKSLGENTEKSIKLPNPKKIRVNLSDAIINRRSVRSYKDDKMKLQHLSDILFYTQGVSAIDKIKLDYYEDDLELTLRNTSSGGGLYPVKLYFFARNISEIEDGIYEYYPESHSINLITKKENMSDVTDYADFAMIDVSNVNLIFFYVYNLLVNSRKYGNIGAAFGFIEAGQLSQNIQLVSSTLGYGVCDIGGYIKHIVEKDLNIDGVNKHLIHMTIVGSEGDE